MSLAARLDRLRGRTLESQPAQSAPDPLVARLHGLQRTRRGGGGGGRASPAVLGQALEALQPERGLLLRYGSVPAPAGSDGSALPGLPETWSWPAPDWVYIDTETIGLSSGVGNLAFMIGAARYAADGSLDLMQFVLGEMGAEAVMLRRLLEWLGHAAVLVSYNGKCFDLPLLVARCRAQRLACQLDQLRHLDLLYTVRRAYRRAWPDCRLQTAESRLLGLHRVGDLPGAEAPRAWQAWLRHGHTAPMQGVLAHNRQDLVSLAQLHRRLVSVYAGGDPSAPDHLAMARAWLRAGRPDRALTLSRRVELPPSVCAAGVEDRSEPGYAAAQLSLLVDRTM
jgi:hypothetical protein